MLILNMYSMSKLYQYRIFPIARLLGPPTILYFPLIFPHARLFGTLLLLGTLVQRISKARLLVANCNYPFLLSGHFSLLWRFVTHYQYLPAKSSI